MFYSLSMVKDGIFHAYDIRGVYPDEINEDAVFKIASALVKFLNPDKLVIASDSRKSSEPLKEAAAEAILASGVDVIDIGEASSPLFYFAVNRLKAAGGIMITASHNPKNYNGMKLVREQAIPIGESNGLLQIKKLAENAANVVIDKIRRGKVIRKDLSDECQQYVLEKAGLAKEPEIKGVRFGFDSDSDRLMVYAVEGEPRQGREKNKIIRPDLLSGVIIRDFFEKPRSRAFGSLRGRQNFFGRIFSKPKFVYDLRFTKAIPEYIKENGGAAVRSRVGHVFIKEAMRGNKAIFGAELSGHFYFKDTFYVESPILMKLKLLKIMQQSGKSLGELTEPFKKYFHSGGINIEYKESGIKYKMLEDLKEFYRDGKIDELDGLTVEYPEWWFNLRPSNTEQVLRLVVEARMQYILEQKVKEITEAVRRFSA